MTFLNWFPIGLSSILFLFVSACGNKTTSDTLNEKDDPVVLPVNDYSKTKDKEISVGAIQTDDYLPLLQDKNIALTVNHTSFIGQEHLVDFLLDKEVGVRKIFAPEHGFRGRADAGATVENGKDKQTGLPIISLYGKRKKPLPDDLKGIDVVVFDIQDVGARFYTYISTMHYVMEACAEKGIPVIVLDRPNPNGHYIDGPILEENHRSFVGMHKIPIVHGLTVGELARMINGEKWLENGIQCDLTVIPCKDYTHNSVYELPIKPSPNLPNMRSIYLYPSLCFFEGTDLNVGRGTTKQFQIFGHPDYPNKDFEFTPVSRPGAKHPKHKNKTCYGVDLSDRPIENIRQEKKINLQYLMDGYQKFPDKNAYFLKNKFIDKLAGTSQLRKDILAGKTEMDIRNSWQTGLDTYSKIRKKYLLYPDFE